jgi:uncharacterized SAM-binding protein YcdF (DUF218 family)
MGFLALCCLIGLALRWRGWIRAGRAWLLTVYIAYVLAGLPVLANSIAAALSDYVPLQDLGSVGSADVLIVLHGDNVRGRVREAKRVFDAATPPVVIVSGGPDFIELIIAGGIPEERIVREHHARNTAQQVVYLADFVRQHAMKKAVLIASRLQMPRIAALTRAERWDVVLAPSPVDAEPPQSGVGRFIPRYAGLRVTRDALYEHLAIRYYRRKQLISQGRPPFSPPASTKDIPAAD